MNERIKLLAEQAYIADSLEYNPNWEKNPVYVELLKELESFHQKFAELLIKECLSKVDASHPLEERSEWGQNSWAEETIKRKIKRHFGVE